MSERKALEGGGSLEIREQGMMVQLNVCRSLETSALYKAWVHGSGGEFLLGTLIPEGQQLRLNRTLSIDTLKKAGCWPILGGRTAKHIHFSEPANKPKKQAWRWEHCPACRFSDPVLKESASNWGSMLFRSGSQGFQLAIPFNPRRPFPLAPAFCFAKLLPVDGQPHVVFSFDSHGTPLRN